MDSINFWEKIHFSDCVLRGIFIVFLLLPCVDSHAQKDTIYKNNLRFNITNYMIFGDHSLIFGYERMVSENQSFSINIGTASYPAFIYDHSDTILLLHQEDYADQGFHVSGDYRFYLKSENKYPAPRGIYIGPYYVYNQFKRTNNWTLNSDASQGDVQSDLKFNFHIVGIQLGYQFVFWNRLSLDLLIFGPGIGFYSLNASVSSSLTEEDEQLFFEALNTSLSTQIPWYERVIEVGDFKSTGSVRITEFGFRYMVLVGFRF